MSNDINGLLSTFKTNMMNAGVAIESEDKFKNLIDKIKGLTEGEGNKGIQFAEGTTDMIFTETNNSYNPYTDTATIDIPINLNFEPNIIIITGFKFSQTKIHDGICLINGLDTIIRLDGNSIYGTLKIKEFNKDKITIQISTNNYNYKVSLYSDAATYYAIGVGEEDTTLRDSLASILQDKGVEVTEEDDLASLINKVATLGNNDGKGIKFAKGSIDNIKLPAYTSGFKQYPINLNIDFTPSILIINIGKFIIETTSTYYTANTTINSLIHNSSSNAAVIISSTETGMGAGHAYISSSNQLYISNLRYEYSVDLENITYYAIGETII
jgi:hypothetical protein